MDLKIILKRKRVGEKWKERGLKIKIPKKISFLIVDDSDELRFTIKTLLEMMTTGVMDIDVSVVEAVNGFDAMLKIQNQTFDYYICDKNMPIKNGLKLVEDLIARKVKSDKILLISGELKKEDILFMKQYGINHILTKPFSSEAFINKIKQMTSVNYEKTELFKKIS